jgi:hypothetical protein
MPSIPLTKESLKKSQNRGIQELADHQFLYTNLDFDVDYSPATQLYMDVVRGAKLNESNNSDREFMKRIADVSRDVLTEFMQAKFPLLSPEDLKKRRGQILGLWDRGDQLPAFLAEAYPEDKAFQAEVLQIRRDRHAGLIAELKTLFPGKIYGVEQVHLLLKYYSQKPQYPSISPFLIIAAEKGLGLEAMKQSITIRSAVEGGEHKIYYQTDVPLMTVKNLKTDEEIQIKGSKWTFELKPNGFEFVSAIAYSQDVHDMLMGALPDDLKWFNLYPLSKRIQDAYQRAPITQPLKFLGEFLPHCIESVAGWAANYLQDVMPNKSVINNTPLRLIARGFTYLAIALLDVLYVAAKSARLLISRVTSPVRSYQEAKALHPVLGYLSALVSVTAIIAVAIFASPIMSAIGLNGAAAWVVAHTGPVGAFLQGVGAKIAGLVGESVSSAMAGMMGFAAALFSLAFLPLINYFESKKQPPQPVFNPAQVVVIPEPEEEKALPLEPSSGHTSRIAGALQPEHEHKQEQEYKHESALGDNSEVASVTIHTPTSSVSRADSEADEMKLPEESDELLPSSDNSRTPPRSP